MIAAWTLLDVSERKSMKASAAPLLFPVLQGVQILPADRGEHYCDHGSWIVESFAG